MKQVQLQSGNLLMFEHVSHIYRIGPDWATGENVPGLHEVMERHGIIEPMNDAVRPWVERGKRVHDAVEQFWNGTYDENSVWGKSPESAYLRSYFAFLDAHLEFSNPLTVEEPAASEEAWLATIPDQKHTGNRVLQIKTGKPNAKVHAVQLALEGLLAFPSAAGFERWAVYLDPVLYADSGGFKLYQYTDDESLQVALEIMKFRMTIRRYMTTRRKPMKAVS